MNQVDITEAAEARYNQIIAEWPTRPKPCGLTLDYDKAGSYVVGLTPHLLSRPWKLCICGSLLDVAVLMDGRFWSANKHKHFVIDLIEGTFVALCMD